MMFAFVVCAAEPRMATTPKMNAALSRWGERKRKRERDGAVSAASSEI